MASPEDQGRTREIEEFLGEPTLDLEAWYELLDQDRTFPISSHRGGWMGRLVVWFKGLFRPFLKAPLSDLWDRQRAFNLIVIEHLRRLDVLDQARADLHRDLLEVRDDLMRDTRSNYAHIQDLEESRTKGFADVMRHSDALYSLIDQKIDAVQRERKAHRELLEELTRSLRDRGPSA